MAAALLCPDPLVYGITHASYLSVCVWDCQTTISQCFYLYQSIAVLIPSIPESAELFYRFMRFGGEKGEKKKKYALKEDRSVGRINKLYTHIFGGGVRHFSSTLMMHRWVLMKVLLQLYSTSKGLFDPAF